MDKINKFKAYALENISKLGKAVKKALETIVDTADEAFKYYDAHKTTINRIGLGLLSIGAWRWVGGRPDSRTIPKDELDRRFYDKRMGRYVYARRAPNDYEMDEIEARYRVGKETYRDILRSMGLL